MKKLIFTLGLLVSLTLSAQDKYEITEDDYNNTKVEMADEMRSNGKIYVVVTVIMVVFAGLLLYVIQTDRKITRLEREVFSEKG